MLKKTLCRAKLNLQFKCAGPLLVCDGDYASFIGSRSKCEKEGVPSAIFANKRGAQSCFDQLKKSPHDARHLDFEYFIPGTSLRGPVRAQAESIIRSLSEDDAQSPYTACDPFDTDTSSSLCSCTERLQSECPPIYASACPACKLFGCGGLKSRLSIEDGIFSNYQSAYRDLVGIDRFTGGVAGSAKFKYLLLENSEWSSGIVIENFETWQLGLLQLVLKDINDGQVQFGLGKSKGFGSVTVGLDSMKFEYVNGSNSNGNLLGLAGLMTPEQCNAYAVYCEEPSIHDSEAAFNLVPENIAGISIYDTYGVSDINAFAARASGEFLARMRQLKEPDESTI